MSNETAKPELNIATKIEAGTEEKVAVISLDTLTAIEFEQLRVGQIVKTVDGKFYRGIHLYASGERNRLVIELA